jgi:ATP-dependent DNA ligase
LLERRRFIPETEVLKRSEYRLISFPEERAIILDYFSRVLEQKYEGIILKGVNDKYFTNDTRKLWQKLKRGFSSVHPGLSKIELDLVVMGANRGEGFKNYNQYTSFLMGTPYQGKIVPISQVGSGLTEELQA